MLGDLRQAIDFVRYYASPLEVSFFVVASCGAGYTTRALRQVVRKRHSAIQMNAREAVIMYASVRVRQESFRLLSQAFFMAAAISAMMIPNAHVSQTDYVIRRSIILVSLIGAEVSAVVNTILDQRSRSRVMHELAQEGDDEDE